MAMAKISSVIVGLSNATTIEKSNAKKIAS